jgi:hypothetical protein
MTGKINADLAIGMTICFVGEITATLQNRHKVVYEIFEEEAHRPHFRIYLDNRDYLVVSLYEQDGTERSADPISPNKFAAYYINRARASESERACTFVIRLTPQGAEEAGDNVRIQVEVFIDNTLQASTTLVGRFAGYNVEQMHSLGAESKGELPATFTLAELYLTKGPMSDDDLRGSAGYMKRKWDIGHDIEYHRSAVEKTAKGLAMIVEDKYDAIYKVAWLSLNEIPFTEQSVNEVFDFSSDFNVIGMHGAGGVSGFLRAKNPDIYQGNRYVGLFDFDREGRENFHNLKREKFWPDEDAGPKGQGHYKKRLDYDGCAAMLLPVPERLGSLADLSYSHFSSYIEVENLLPEKFLKENLYCEELVTVGVSYLKVKDSCKSSLWRKACALPKEAFIDFVPLFQTARSLMIN